MKNATRNETLDPCDRYFAGEELIGDRFSPEELEEWFSDEVGAYQALNFDDCSPSVYLYHELNVLHGYRSLHPNRTISVLGIGSSFGEEFRPILNLIEKIIIVEPGERHGAAASLEVPVEYVQAHPLGRLDVEDSSADLAVSFGSLHHIANVSFVLKEIGRALKADGLLLIREPSVSMGDWRRRRVGLTKRERGIPPELLRRALQDAGFVIQREVACMFPLTAILGRVMGIAPYNSKFLVRLDAALCQLSNWNWRYHRKKWYEKFAPTSIFVVASKQSDMGSKAGT